MHTAKLIFTVIIATIFMGCPPPVSDNPASGSNAPASDGDDSAPGDNPVPVRKHHAAYVSAGQSHTMIVKTDDSLWAVGRNNIGQLGDGSTTDASIPVQVITAAGQPMTEVDQISAGHSHTMILKKNSTVWAVGGNAFGQLGDGSTNDASIPVQVMIDVGQPMTEVAYVSAGTKHSMIVKKNGTVWAVGYNGSGQLGDGTNNNTATPVQVMIDVDQPMTQAARVSVGTEHSMIIKQNGTLWAVGSNTYGQLGDGTTTRRLNPVRVREKPPEGGAAREMTGVVARVSSSEYRSMILKRDDTLWAVGQNRNGQLGNGNISNFESTPLQVMTGVDQVSSGRTHTMILKKNGTLWAVGNNFDGQLGTGDPRRDGKPNPVEVMTDVARVSSRYDHTMIVKQNGTLWAVGLNEHGQLGNGASGSGVRQLAPVKIRLQ